MSLERNIKFNDDNSITIDGIKYIPESKTDCNKNIESEKRCTGIDSPGTYDTIYYVNKHGELKRHPYFWQKFYKPYLRGRVVKDAILSLSRDKATQIRFALEKYASENSVWSAIYEKQRPCCDPTRRHNPGAAIDSRINTKRICRKNGSV